MPKFNNDQRIKNTDSGKNGIIIRMRDDSHEKISIIHEEFITTLSSMMIVALKHTNQRTLLAVKAISPFFYILYMCNVYNIIL